MDERFGNLRSLLQQRESRFAWEELCQRIAAYPSPEREQAVIPYVTAHLNHWEDRRRVLTPAWREDAVSKRPPQHLDLVRAIIVPTNDAPGLAVMRRVFKQEFMRLVTHVDLTSMQRVPVTEALLASPTLEHLTVLRVTRPIDAASIGADPRLDGLEELEIRSAGLTSGDMRDLVTQRARPRLTSLCLAQNDSIDAHDVRALCHAHANFPALERLDLSMIRLRDASLRILADSPLVRNLRSLFIDTRSITHDGARALAASAHLPEHLREVWAKRAARMQE